MNTSNTETELIARTHQGVIDRPHAARATALCAAAIAVAALLAGTTTGSIHDSASSPDSTSSTSSTSSAGRTSSTSSARGSSPRAMQRAFVSTGNDPWAPLPSHWGSAPRAGDRAPAAIDSHATPASDRVLARGRR